MKKTHRKYFLDPKGDLKAQASSQANLKITPFGKKTPIANGACK